MPLPTENVGSLPRPLKLQAAIKDYDAGKISFEQLSLEQDIACFDSIKRMEATGAPIVSDGEQRASSFATYPITDTLAGTGLAKNLAGDGQYFAVLGGTEYRGHVNRNAVGEHDFFEQADGKNCQTNRKTRAANSVGFRQSKLRHHLLVMQHRAGDQVRKIGDK